MKDDDSFSEGLRRQTYQLAVMHTQPDGDDFFVRKCGSEKLYLSVRASDPLAFIRKSACRTWMAGPSFFFPHRLLDEHNPGKDTSRPLFIANPAGHIPGIDRTLGLPLLFIQLLSQTGTKIPGRINISLADPECQTDYYLVCLKSEQKRYERLFKQINDKTIQ